MTNLELLELILSDTTRITTAISTGAQWEIWMQVELSILLKNAGMQVAREVPYPRPYDSMVLDILTQDKQGARYAIELKAESATNAGFAAGQAIMTALQADAAKIKNYEVASLSARWAVGIAYSATSRGKFTDYAAQFPEAVITGEGVSGEGGSISVIVIDASAL